MDGSKRFFRHALLSYKALFSWLDPKVYLLVMVLAPLSQLLFFSFLVKYVYNGEGLAGYVASNALLLCVMNTVFGIMTIVTSDRSMGTLQLVLVSPTNKVLLFLSRSLFHVVNGLVTACLGLFFGAVLFHISFTVEQLFSLLIVWFVSIFAACGLGFIVGSFCLWSPTMHLWSNLLASALLLLSGANYPRAQLPSWMYEISNFFPLTRGVEVTKGIMSPTRGMPVDQWVLLGQEVVLGVVFYIIGFFLIRYAEHLARVKGTMELE